MRSIRKSSDHLTGAALVTQPASRSRLQRSVRAMRTTRRLPSDDFRASRALSPRRLTSTPVRDLSQSECRQGGARRRHRRCCASRSASVPSRRRHIRSPCGATSRLEPRVRIPPASINNPVSARTNRRGPIRRRLTRSRNVVPVSHSSRSCGRITSISLRAITA